MSIEKSTYKSILSNHQIDSPKRVKIKSDIPKSAFYGLAVALIFSVGLMIVVAVGGAHHIPGYLEAAGGYIAKVLTYGTPIMVTMQLLLLWCLYSIDKKAMERRDKKLMEASDEESSSASQNSLEEIIESSDEDANKFPLNPIGPEVLDLSDDQDPPLVVPSEDEDPFCLQPQQNPNPEALPTAISTNFQRPLKKEQKEAIVQLPQEQNPTSTTSSVSTHL